MLESVDKSVSNTDAERRAGSTPALGTRLYKSPLANRQICKGIFVFGRKGNPHLRWGLGKDSACAEVGESKLT